jgi:hypothetical protein
LRKVIVCRECSRIGSMPCARFRRRTGKFQTSDSSLECVHAFAHEVFVEACSAAREARLLPVVCFCSCL